MGQVPGLPGQPRRAVRAPTPLPACRVLASANVLVIEAQVSLACGSGPLLHVRPVLAWLGRGPAGPRCLPRSLAPAHTPGAPPPPPRARMAQAMLDTADVALQFDRYWDAWGTLSEDLELQQRYDALKFKVGSHS